MFEKGHWLLKILQIKVHKKLKLLIVVKFLFLLVLVASSL